MAATASPLEMTIGQWYDVELSGTPGTITVLVPPKNARYLVIKPRTSPVKLTEPAAGGTDFSTIEGDAMRTIRVPGSGAGRSRNMDTAAAASNSRRVGLASTVASVIVECKATVE